MKKYKLKRNLLNNYDRHDYFCRTIDKLSNESELPNVLKSSYFKQSLPILYVLYGSESKLIKVGKTKSSNHRLPCYLRKQSFSDVKFRLDDTIHLIGYYLMPNFNYDIEPYRTLLNEMENLLINNATKQFGQNVYRNEWFSANDYIYNILIDVPKLFDGFTSIIDSSMYKIVSTPSNPERYRQQVIDMLDEVDIVKGFLKYAKENGYLDNHKIPRDWLYQLFRIYEAEHTSSRMSEAAFTKRSVKILESDYGFSPNVQQITYTKLTPLDFCESPYRNEIESHKFGMIPTSLRKRVYINESNLLTQDDVDDFKMRLESDGVDINDFKDYRLASYCAKIEQNSLAQSLINE